MKSTIVVATVLTLVVTNAAFGQEKTKGRVVGIRGALLGEKGTSGETKRRAPAPKAKPAAAIAVAPVASTSRASASEDDGLPLPAAPRPVEAQPMCVGWIFNKLVGGAKTELEKQIESFERLLNDCLVKWTAGLSRAEFTVIQQDWNRFADPKTLTVCDATVLTAVHNYCVMKGGDFVKLEQVLKARGTFADYQNLMGKVHD